MLKNMLLRRFLPILLSFALFFEAAPVSAAYNAEQETAVDETEVIGDENGETEAEDEGAGADGGAVETLEAIVNAESGSADDTQSETGLPKAEISIDVKSLGNYVKYDYAANSIVLSYFQDETKYKDAAQDVINAVKSVASVKIDGSAANQYRSQIKTKWQKGGADMAEGTVPHAVGAYSLVVYLDAVENVCTASNAVSIPVEVQKAEVSFGNVNNRIQSGSTVAELKGANQNISLIVNGLTVNKEDYITGTVAIKVMDAWEKETLDDSVVLQNNKDYLMILSVVLKDANSFEIVEDTYNVSLYGTVNTRIAVTYATPGKTIGKTYDGFGIDHDTEIKPEYTAKVVYNDKDGVEKEVAGAEITGIWCDSRKYEYKNTDFQPTDAGTYYYKLKYTDDNGTYADAYEYIEVVIAMAEIVIDPIVINNEVYEGMSAGSIAKGVEYKVYSMVNGEVSAEPLNISEYFWGTVYQNTESIYNDGSQSSSTNNNMQYFVPVFAVQKQNNVTDTVGGVEQTTISWDTMNSNTRIQKDGVYRVVFSGNKALYGENGATADLLVINYSQNNYNVNITDEVIGKYAKELKVNASTQVKVDISALLQEENGTSLTKPIIKTYSGVTGALYSNKGEYKIATVKKVEDGSDTGISSLDGRLSYTWQKCSFTTRKVNVWNGESNEQKTYIIPNWSTASYTDVDSASAPYSAGVYRLRVSFSDPSGEYSLAYASRPDTDAYGEVILDSLGNQTTVDEAQAGYVYYVIKPQDAVMTLKGTPAIYADGINNVHTLLISLQRHDETDTETYVERSIYPITVTGTDSLGNAVYTKDEQNPILTDFYIDAYNNSSYPYFYVEKQLKEGDGILEATNTEYKAGDWIRCSNYEVFENNRNYRLCVEGNGYYSSNYNFGRKLDIINRTEKTGYFSNESIAINIKKTEAIRVSISVDEEKITNNVKTYDGKPIDITSLKNLVKVNSLADDGTVSGDVTEAVKDKLHYELDYTSNDGLFANMTVSEKMASHGGEYRVIISLDTDDTYQASSYTADIKYVIEPRELKVTPILADEIPAGISSSNINSYVVGQTFEGWESGDEDTPANTEEKVISLINWRAYEKYTSQFNNLTLKSSKSYYVKEYSVIFQDCKDDYFEDDIYNDSTGEYERRYISYGNDYVISSGTAEFTPVRVAARTETNNTRFKDTVTKEAENGFAHMITPIEGVPYLYDLNLDGNMVDGNYFIFNIYAPTEIGNFSNVVYENKILNYGCYVIGGGGSSRYITVACHADKNAYYNFDIMWEPGYTENFVVDLGKAILQNDFEKAVAPKSLAFNGVNTKMAAGETQQLDVKITKAQLDDIILLGYKSSDDAIVKVNESGFVTAVAKKGSATIEVYPCRLVDGVKTPITGKGIKSAKVKITVTEVAAPKISKVIAKDTFATIQYVKPVNGYRREVYVMNGKQTAKAFEDEIAKVKNGDYSAFVYVDFISPETTDEKGVVTKSVTGLVPDGNQYTVYLRNVSGLRTLDGGRQVEYSHVGTVKNFKTIKAQAEALDLYFDSSEKGQTARRDYDYSDIYYDHYTAPLTGKSAKVSLKAEFLERYSQNYSDAPDYIWRTLPLASNLKKNYTLPKPVYYVTSDIDGRITEKTWKQLDDISKKAYFYCVNGYYYPVCNIATVDKSGKVSFKGKGTVYVMAFDSNKPSLKDTVVLHITASPDTVKGKSVKLQVGQSIYLSSYLEYTEKKIKVVDYNYYYSDLSVSAKSNEYFSIQKSGDDYVITALKSGKNAKLDLGVTDNVVKANGGKDTVVKLSVSAIEPVKNLKADLVFDDRFDVTFTHSQGGSCDFRIGVTDARGSVISNEIRTLAGTWDPKTKKYVYRTGYSYSKGDHITRLSTYNITVTAIYQNEESKEAKTKVKTTNIPASYRSLSPDDINAGCNIRVTTDYNGSIYLSSLPLKSGNTYTLNFVEENTDARLRMTDTLVWKSSNPKVASIKANAGTYSATLKTVREGVTTIEVSSKVTKKVVSRYNVYVCAAGDAYEYFGDNESYNGKNPANLDELNERDIIVVTQDSDVKVALNRYEEQWFVFTAPEDGNYSVYISNSSYNEYYVLNGSELREVSSNTNTLSKNQKIYVKVANKSPNRRAISISVY